MDDHTLYRAMRDDAHAQRMTPRNAQAAARTALAALRSPADAGRIADAVDARDRDWPKPIGAAQTA